MRACVLLQTRKSARAGMDKNASRAKARVRRANPDQVCEAEIPPGSRSAPSHPSGTTTSDLELPIAPRRMRPSLAFISVEFTPSRFPYAARELELIRKPDAARKASLAGISLRHAIRRQRFMNLLGHMTVAHCLSAR